MAAMLEPRINYARTSDGLNIAFTTIGDGDGIPVIALRAPQLSHIGREFQLPFETQMHEFERMARGRMVVRFDTRGSGLSDRDVEDISIDARIRDIDAVADKLGLEQFALHASVHACMWAIAYAAARPERVSHVVVQNAYTRGSTYWDQPGRAALEPLASIDWVTYTEASMSHAFGWIPGDIPRALAAQMRAAMTPKDFLRYLAVDRETDVTDLLSEVRCPVLVHHFQLSTLTTQDMAIRLAGSVRDGRLSLPKTLGEAIRTMHEFLDEDQRRSAPPADEVAFDEGLRIFLVANAQAQPGAIESAISAHGGAAVASIAGSSTGLFHSAQAALTCARELAENALASIGLHAGEPNGAPGSEADQALVLAVRAAVNALPGQVVVSNVVRELVAGKGFHFAELPESLHGTSDESPRRLFALR